MQSILDSQRLEAIALTHEEIARYSRHLIMPEVTIEGQKRLKAAAILLIGSGGLGSPLGLYLAAAGVGRLGLVDFDVVDHSNLQRQILHGTKDVGRPKIQSAADRIRDVNPNVQLDLHETRFASANAMRIAANYDIIIDGTDNFPTRYLANDVAVLLKKPNVYGSIFRFEGQASVFAPCLGGPCYRCLYPEPPPPGLVPSCAEGGVLGVLPGIIGVIQAIEAVKLILGQGEPLVGRLLLFDALAMKFREMKLRRNPRCPICGENPVIRELVDYEQFCGLTPAAGPVAAPPGAEEISVGDLKRRLDAKEDFDLIDVRDPHEWQIVRIPGARLIPLGELPDRLSEVNPGREIVLHCKSGGRSGRALKLLKEKGYKNLKNVTGGILAWATHVDPTMPKY
ncbi:MAG: molybdopterin-synthase adenylyltransferase MoeB [Verrucomicrobia bacterium]|nr:molybdopterin-synthase adenylyltransferase MoeB [Verrucomicrobiota bacterium]